MVDHFVKLGIVPLKDKTAKYIGCIKYVLLEIRNWNKDGGNLHKWDHRVYQLLLSFLPTSSDTRTQIYYQNTLYFLSKSAKNMPL